MNNKMLMVFLVFTLTGCSVADKALVPTADFHDGAFLTFDPDGWDVFLIPLRAGQPAYQCFVPMTEASTPPEAIGVCRQRRYNAEHPR